MNFFQRKLKEQDKVDRKIAYEGLMGYRVARYFSEGERDYQDFYFFDDAKRYAMKNAKKYKILCRVFEQYPSGDKQVFEIDKTEKYDDSMGCLSWFFIILGIAFVACSIILPVFYP